MLSSLHYLLFKYENNQCLMTGSAEITPTATPKIPWLSYLTHSALSKSSKSKLLWTIVSKGYPIKKPLER